MGDSFFFNKPIHRAISNPLLLTETSMFWYFRVVLPHLTGYHQVLLNEKNLPWGFTNPLSRLLHFSRNWKEELKLIYLVSRMMRWRDFPGRHGKAITGILSLGIREIDREVERLKSSLIKVCRRFIPKYRTKVEAATEREMDKVAPRISFEWKKVRKHGILIPPDTVEQKT